MRKDKPVIFESARWQGVLAGLLVVAAIFTTAQIALYGYYYAPGSLLRFLHIVMVAPAYAVGMYLLFFSNHNSLARSLGVIAFLIIAYLSVLWSPPGRWGGALMQLYLQTATVPLSLLIINEKMERTFMWAAIGSAVFVVASNWYYAFALGLWEGGYFRLGHYTAPQRLSNPNTVAYILGLGILLCLQLLLVKKTQAVSTGSKRRLAINIMLIAAAIVFGVSLFFTRSRGGMLATGAALAVVLFIEYRRVFWSLLLSGLGALLLLAGASSLNLLSGPIETAVEETWGRVNAYMRIDQGLWDYTFLFENAYKFARQNPARLITGYGIYEAEVEFLAYVREHANWQEFLDRTKMSDDITRLHVHNGYLGFALSYGLVGILAVCKIIYDVVGGRRSNGLIYMQYERHLAYAFVVFVFFAALQTYPFANNFGIVINALLLYWLSRQPEGSTHEQHTPKQQPVNV